MGKGDRPRHLDNKEAYDANYERIFRNKSNEDLEKEGVKITKVGHKTIYNFGAWGIGQKNKSDGDPGDSPRFDPFSVDRNRT